MRYPDWTKRAATIGLLTILAAAMISAEPAPPMAKIVPKVDTMFGVTMIDNYSWLREKANPEVIDYLKAENAYTDSMTAGIKDLQEQLYKEIIGRIKETDMSLPVKRDDYYYYSRDEKGKQYKIYCRKKGSLEAAEEIYLDVNALGEGKSYVGVSGLTVSPNHELLAYALDTLGNEIHTIHVKNMATGETYADAIPNADGGLAWASDNKTVFYTTLDDILRPWQVWRHIVGTDPGADVKVFEEPDQRFFVSISRSKSDKFIFMSIGSQVTSEAWYLDAGNPLGEFRVIEPRRQDIEYAVDHHGDKFFILTNDQAKNFKLMETPITATGRENWKEVIAGSNEVMLEGMEMFRDHLVISKRSKAQTQLEVRNLATGEIHDISFPEPVYTVRVSANPDFNSATLRLTFMSLVTPSSIFDYNMNSRERTLMKQQEVVGGHDPSQYQSERIYARAADGTMIPISLVYKKGLKRDGANPCWLTGYGAYGIPSDPYFSNSRLSLLNRGFVYALAHIRGGGDNGRTWYDDGKYFHKKNTFTDFIACAEALISEKFTSTEKLAVNGGSAGGLLMGAVLNMRPDLFKIVVADVPFVDLINTMRDSTIPLTVTEWEEWGNPLKKDFFEYMLSYSPYDNVAKNPYPDVLITAGLNDPRVAYWEPAKLTAKLRANKTDKNLLILKTRMDSGHGGASGRYDAIKDVAFEYAVVMGRLGLAKVKYNLKGE
jgi:oligopeptidase B